MPNLKITKEDSLAEFDLSESRIRNLVFTVALIIGMLTTIYFGIDDAIHKRIFPGLVSLFVVLIFCAMLLYNYFFARIRRLFHTFFVILVGITFLVLQFTQFPDPAIVFWCFPFPLVALFLLGSKKGAVALLFYNIGIIIVFILDSSISNAKYTYEYAIRYCGAMITISILSYYYEGLRNRSVTTIRAMNQTLEQRVAERTKELETSQERLRQSEKLEAIGLLAGGIAHDFNNRLTGIMAFADLIRVTSQNNSEISELAEGILSSSRRSAELTSQLLAFARKGNLLAVPVDIHHIVGNVITFLKHTIDKRINLKQELKANPSTLLGDPTALENAILNLALNARDAMPVGGDILFTTNIVNLEQEYCKSFPHEIVPGIYLRLSITDTGCGMDKKTLSRIFEPFFTTKEPGKGTGMGLPAVYGTIQSLKGAITVYSEPDHGSSFHLYFPILKIENKFYASEGRKVSMNKEHGNILLVDDELSVSESVKKLLQLLGYTVTVFHNGRDALEFYSDNWKSIDLVIIDMIMPIMGGKDTFIAMKNINLKIVALLASGYSLNGEAQGILDLGAKDFIQKPFDMAELREKVTSLLEKRD